MDSIDIHHIGFGDKAPAHVFWQCDDPECVRLQRGKFDKGQTRALHLPCKTTNDYWFTFNDEVVGNGSKRETVEAFVKTSVSRTVCQWRVVRGHICLK